MTTRTSTADAMRAQSAIPALGRSADGVLFWTDTDDPAHVPHKPATTKGTGGVCLWTRLLRLLGVAGQ